MSGDDTAMRSDITALHERIAGVEDRTSAIEGRVSLVEHRMGVVESRQSRTERLLLMIQGEVRSMQKGIFQKLDEMKELLSLGLGKTVIKAVKDLDRRVEEVAPAPAPPPVPETPASDDEFSKAVDRLDD